ncbi:MAG: DUF2470 domain-containing protein [Alphaproteobacteria bacterium]|jgi:putative heme iron utilization protein|nr:DUF2470 domain-containing protein [Alphaproteobacteria bacterium]
MTARYGREARGIMRRLDRAVLATAHGPQGWPFGSLVLLALDHDATPLLLISALAEHSKAIAADPRVSLLVDGTAGLANPLAGPRVTVLGRAEPHDDPSARARYLARHPDAALYAGFTDFCLHRIAIERAHFVAGFGRISWIEPADLLFDTAGCQALAEGETALLAHLNTRHAEAIQALAPWPPPPGDSAGWALTGVDPEGADLRQGGSIARIDFDPPVTTPEAAEAALLRLAEEPRTQSP